MAKSDVPLKDIRTDPAEEQLNEPSFAGDKDVNALDFETADGDPFMLQVQFANGDSVVYPQGRPDGTLSAKDVFDVLTHKRFRNSLNFWYNLNFDASVILKFLPKQELKRLRQTNEAKLNVEGGPDYEITYIPGKFLRLMDEHSNSYKFFDIAQFTYAGKIENAVEKWLGETKTDPVNPQQFGKTDDGNLNDYIVNNWSDIRRYGVEDVQYTRDIAKEIIRIAEDEISPPIPFGQPYSTGYIAADYIRNRLEYKPIYSRDAVQRLAWDAYAGGRFEVFERGSVGAIAGPDINSAYPAVFQDLPDPGTVRWKRTDDLDEIRDADWGFVRFTGTTDADRQIQPFAIKNEDKKRVEYPALDGATTTTILPTFLFAIDAGYLTDFEIETAWIGLEQDVTKYPFEWVPELYNTRKCYENDDAPGETNKRAATLIKIVLNSMYGKTCQTTPQLQQAVGGDGPYTFPISPEQIREDTKPDVNVVIGPDGYPLMEYLRAGRLFNPILASYITGMTRLKLHRATVNNGLEEDAVMFATDCLMIRRDSFEGTDLEQQAETDPEPGQYKDQLGGWDYDYKGDAFIIGSGVYEVEREDGTYKRGVRGFRELQSKIGNDDVSKAYFREADSLRDVASAVEGDKIPIPNTRPMTIGDALTRGDIRIGDVATFIESERNLSAGMDGKRNWEQANPSYDDLLNGSEASKPKIFDGEDWR